jgi:3-dehydrosphinganine reductase
MNERTTVPHAIVTGGSSGIGIALAAQLRRMDCSISIIARDKGRLEEACSMLSNLPGRGGLSAFSADVGDETAVMEAIDAAIIAHGSPEWAIACAGIVRPALFLDSAMDDHLAQLRTNYLGSLFFSRHVLPSMTKGSKLIFVGTGAALLGIYGYSGYGASKFALRGLAEVLRVELRERGIFVTLAYPPDTETPGFAEELKRRPEITTRISRGGGTWKPDLIASKILAGAEARRFVVAPSWQLTTLSALHSLIAPMFRAYQVRVARSAQRSP